MKICHVITRMIIGGAQENTLLTVIGLQNRNHIQVDLISGCEIGPEGRLDLKDVKSLIFVKNLVRNINPLKDIAALIQLMKIFKNKQYDIVHTHSSKAGIIARFAAYFAGVKIIIHTIHGLPFHDYQNPLLNFIYVNLEKICAKITNKIIVVSNQMSVKALQKNIGQKDQFITIHSGMMLDQFYKMAAKKMENREELGIGNDQICIGKIARFFHLKGYDDLFEIASKIIEQYPQVVFLLVGDGVLKDHYEKLIKSMNLSNHFILTGLIDPQKVPYYLSCMDMLIHLSLREGLARVLPQAMATNVPVVSYDIDGAKDIINDQENGYLVKARNLEDLHNKMIQLIESEKTRMTMVKNSQKVIEPYFSEQYMVEQIYQLYLDLKS